MESHTEIVLAVDSVTESEPADAEKPVARALPFSFAKRHGVLIRDIEEGVADTVYRTVTSPLSLAETRRFAGIPLRLTRVTPEAFDAILQQTYEQGSHMAMQMVGDLDEHTDLLQRQGSSFGLLRPEERPMLPPLESYETDAPEKSGTQPESDE